MNTPAGFIDILPGGNVFQGWAANSEPGLVTVNVSADYSAILAANGGSFSYLELIFATQNQVGGTANEAIYIDNVRLVPEPAAVTLLGLGGLAMLRRRAA